MEMNLSNCSLFGVLILLFCSVPNLTADGNDELFNAAVSDLLNTCMDARYHKTYPGPEDSLHSQCSPWANRSCCTVNTSISVHYNKMYKFDWNHCSHVKPLSSKCSHRFRQDLCFYECSPNMGPWLVKINQKIRKQRFVNVPLCRSDCEEWFEDCVEDYTCTDNWGLNFEWTEYGNRCPVGSKCSTFGEIYNNNSTYFCETVWDHSWKVVDDTEHCMRLWFNPEHGNPNDEVARWRAEQILRAQMAKFVSAGATYSSFPHLIVVSLLIIYNQRQ